MLHMSSSFGLETPYLKHFQWRIVQLELFLAKTGPRAERQEGYPELNEGLTTLRGAAKQREGGYCRIAPTDAWDAREYCKKV